MIDFKIEMLHKEGENALPRTGPKLQKWLVTCVQIKMRALKAVFVYLWTLGCFWEVSSHRRPVETQLKRVSNLISMTLQIQNTKRSGCFFLEVIPCSLLIWYTHFVSVGHADNLVLTMRFCYCYCGILRGHLLHCCSDKLGSSRDETEVAGRESRH